MSVIIFTRSTSSPGRSAVSTESRLHKITRQIPLLQQSIRCTIFLGHSQPVTSSWDTAPTVIVLSRREVFGCKSPSNQAKDRYTCYLRSGPSSEMLMWVAMSTSTWEITTQQLWTGTQVLVSFGNLTYKADIHTSLRMHNHVTQLTLYTYLAITLK